MNFIAVTLEWVANNGVSYVVYVAPERAINYTAAGKSSAHLLLSYNIKYNISVVASLCGITQAIHSIINYSKLQLKHSTALVIALLLIIINIIIYRNMPSNSELRCRFCASYKSQKSSNRRNYYHF